MKHIAVILGTAFTSLLLGCATAPVALAPVGPNPTGRVNLAANGQLEVFSALHMCRDGNEFDINPVWYQHTDYTVCNVKGKQVRHVFNTVGYYEQAPRPISLPAGKYFVRARAQDSLRVEVPVVIESGRTTRVHLDDHWSLPPDVLKTELVYGPGGHPVGWRLDATKEMLQ